MLSTKLLDGAALPSTASATVNVSGRKDEAGVTQVENTAAVGTYTVSIQGRADPNAPWAELATVSDTDETAETADTAAVTHKTMPQMRHVLSAVGGGATLNSWLVE